MLLHPHNEIDMFNDSSINFPDVTTIFIVIPTLVIFDQIFLER